MASEGAAIEYLATTRMGKKGQLTLPKEFREDLGLNQGVSFVVIRLGDALLLLPEQQRFERLYEKITETLGRAGITQEVALAALPEARRRFYARHYRKNVQPPNRRR